MGTECIIDSRDSRMVNPGDKSSLVFNTIYSDLIEQGLTYWVFWLYLFYEYGLLISFICGFFIIKSSIMDLVRNINNNQ